MNKTKVVRVWLKVKEMKMKRKDNDRKKETKEKDQNESNSRIGENKYIIEQKKVNKIYE